MNANESSKGAVSRRAAVAAGLAPLVVARHVLGGVGYQAPSDKLRIAAVGVGGVGEDYLTGCASEDIVALCGTRLGPGTLYGALARLEKSGLIQAIPAQDRRRPYRLTAIGIAALREQLSLLQKLAATGLKRLALE